MLILTLYLIFLNSAYTKYFHIEKSNNLDSCFTSIINKYFNGHSNIIIDNKVNKTNFFSPYLSKIVFSSNEFLSQRLEEIIVTSYTITYDIIDQLNRTLAEIQASPWFSSTINYIIIANGKFDIQEIVNHLWNFRLYKSVILLPTNSKVELYAIDLENSKCGTDIKPKKVNEYREGKFQQKLRLFSADIKKNYYKCPFRIIWCTNPPWVFYVNDSDPGIYINVLDLFEEVSQFKVIYMPQTDVYREEINAGYNFDSIIEDFDRDYADLFVGLVSYASNMYLQSTSIIYDDNLYFIVPKPKIIPYYKMATKMFSLTIWILAFMVFILISCLITLLALTSVEKKIFGNLGSNLLYVFGLYLNIGVHKKASNFRLRLFLGSQLLLSLILSASFQGKCYSAISSPLYEKPITNLEDLLDSDVPIKFTEGLRLIFMYTDELSAIRVLEKMEVIQTLDLLENSYRAYTENFATIIDRGVLIMYPHLKHMMEIFEVYTFQSCLFMQRNHILYEYFDKTIQRIVESGFVDRIISVMKFSYANKQPVVEENRIFSISMNQMEGVYLILLSGYCISLTAFICEHIYFYYKKYHGHGKDKQTEDTKLATQQSSISEL